MGSIWATKLPSYFDKWGMPYSLRDGWQTRSRGSGGFNSVKGIGVHHDASSAGASADSAYDWSCHGSSDAPVGNGSLSRNGSFQLWAAGAANTMGKGGPVWTQRGTIAQDDGNANMFAIEAANSGTGEPWTAAQITNYPILCCAVLDWAIHETPGAAMAVGDVISHWEWCQPTCPGRKIDPAGPAPWMPAKQVGPTPTSWDMNSFRSSVYTVARPTPGPGPSPSPTPSPEEDDMIIFGLTDYSNTWSQQGVHLSPETYAELTKQGAVRVDSAFHGQHIKSLLAVSGLTEDDLDPRT